jgi:hypothetical protein
MSSHKLTAIKEQLAQATERLRKEDIEWLVKRVEELESENDFLKKELRYLEYQGEVEL